MLPVWIFRHTADESPGTLAAALDEAGLAWEIIDLWRALPNRFDPAALAGLVVLGGPMNADEVVRNPFLLPEVQWIRQAVDADLPVLGICLGGQLLAQALGGRVYRHRHKEIGWYDVEFTGAAVEDRLWGGMEQRQRLFQWHGDTFDLPAGGVPLAYSVSCPAQAFRYGTRAYGLQFHLEATAEVIQRWLNEPAGREEIAALDYIDAVAMQAETAAGLAGMYPVARRVFGRFAELCRQRQGEVGRG